MSAGPAAPCYNLLIGRLVIGDGGEIAELLNHPLSLLFSIGAWSYIDCIYTHASVENSFCENNTLHYRFVLVS